MYLYYFFFVLFTIGHLLIMMYFNVLFILLSIKGNIWIYDF